VRPDLVAVREAFESWLYVPDPGALYAVLATAAAHRLDGDPTWLQLVSPSSGGKTEILNALSALPEVHHAATLTEAALLSGTPKREKAADAKGGLLRSIGDSGVLCLKDFGSVLSMNRDARAALLAALREIYDGAWTRHVGTDGGRALHWSGKLTLIAGCTPAIDQHHAVIAQLGERFCIYRLSVDDATEHARRSLAHARHEKAMRAELRDAVGGFFDGLTFTAPDLTAGDIERLVALSTLVVRCRSAVIRDAYSSREIELVPDAEAPGRVVGTLERMLAGLRVIGVDHEEAWRVVVKVGLDSMPALRRKAIELLLTSGGDQRKTSEIATACGLPTSTTLRVLEDLAAHAVIQRYSGGGQGKADHWQIAAWTAAQYQAATSPETSEVHLYEDPSKDPDRMFNNISGEVAPLGEPIEERGVSDGYENARLAEVALDVTGAFVNAREAEPLNPNDAEPVVGLDPVLERAPEPLLDVMEAARLTITGHAWDEATSEDAMRDDFQQLQHSAKTTGTLDMDAVLELWRAERGRRYGTAAAVETA